MQNWEEFKTKYYNANPQDPGWKEDFDHIDRQIREAAKIVKSGTDLMADNNMDYFLGPSPSSIPSWR